MPHVERSTSSTGRASFDAKHSKDHELSAARKADRDGSGRMDRHSGELIWRVFGRWGERARVGK